MRFLRRRKQQDYEEFDDFDPKYEDHHPPHYEESLISDSYTYDWEDEYEPKKQGNPLTSMIIMLSLLFYGAILLLGLFTTEYTDGKGYVVSSELRKERSYIKEVTPFYTALQSTVEKISTYEQTSSNIIDLQTQLRDLKTLIHSLKEKEKSVLDVPRSLEMYQSFLLNLADRELEYIDQKIAYHQDKKEDRIPPMKELKQEVIYLNTQAESQMMAIREKLSRNVK